ncbi:aspartate--tRNA ligase [Candidatus Peribacteria bacterium RIFCSPHIGHO2_01_FULL_51_9]|nr:MAG: aspartate--tRNA ligase [Candidatus Peribacteria bacterium RIFCSPHIGHO2_01_FULL_51_9]
MLRTHTCGELRTDHTDQEVVLCGWIHRRRDHGGLIFVDLRDRYGFTQIVFDPKNKDVFSQGEKVRSEWVLQITGTVRLRLEGAKRKDNPTGEIEVLVQKVETLSESKTPPFEIDQEKEVNEDLRLQYRFLDLRRPRMQEILKNRDALIAHIRQYMHERNFVEVQTPILANSSPEGARDYLVPSRLHKGMFYALPQAPQQFKQLLMVAGLDRYFQIAPCFRDEDPRADRHPGEFYQLDFEMSFVTQEDVFQTIEPLMIELTHTFSDKKVVWDPFPRIVWKDALNTYGSDKPDLRYDLKLNDVSELVKDSGFSVFADVIKKKGVVKALKIPKGAELSRKDIDELTEVAKIHGAKGLAYILVKSDGPQSPIIKFLGEDVTKKILEHVEAHTGDAIFFSADMWLTACKSLGAVRIDIARRQNLMDPKKAAWAWIVDFPMYEWNEEDHKVDFSHNPFSMPQGGMEALLTKDPLDILAHQYDFVCNGFELTSGAIRNHRPDIMYKAFEIAGYTKDDVDRKFGGMIRAFQYGAPPHGGCAPGIDRLMMVLWECPSIRDIYAFPKNGKAQDVMMGSPSLVTEKQLKELSIKIVEK